MNNEEQNSNSYVDHSKYASDDARSFIRNYKLLNKLVTYMEILIVINIAFALYFAMQGSVLWSVGTSCAALVVLWAINNGKTNLKTLDDTFVQQDGLIRYQASIIDWYQAGRPLNDNTVQDVVDQLKEQIGEDADIKVCSSPEELEEIIKEEKKEHQGENKNNDDEDGAGKS